MNLLIKEYNGTTINFKEMDGNLYADATAMCKPFNKKPINFFDRPTIKRYCDKVSENLTGPIKVSESGVCTWIHEKLILKMAQWLDVDFEIWCDEVIEEYLKHGVVIAEDTTKDKVDESFLYSMRKIRPSFTAAKDKKEYIDNCLNYQKNTADKIKACQAIIRAINSIDLTKVEGSTMMYLEECKTKTLKKEKTLSNNSYGGKVGDLKNKLKKLTPKPPVLDETISCHWYSNNETIQSFGVDQEKAQHAKLNFICWRDKVDSLLGKLDLSQVKEDSTILLSGCMHTLHDCHNLHKSFIDRLANICRLNDRNFKFNGIWMISLEANLETSTKLD